MCFSFPGYLWGNGRGEILLCQKERHFSPCSLRLQLLPAYRCYHSRLYKKFSWCHRKADITSRSKWLEPIPGRTNEELCLITESIQNQSDFVILFRLLSNHSTDEYSRGRDLFCFVFCLFKEKMFFLLPFLPEQCQNHGTDPPY